MTNPMRSLIGVLLLAAGCKTTGDLPYVSDWVLFDAREGLIRFPVMVNGLPARGTLNTGLIGSRIDGRFAKRHLIRGDRSMLAEDFVVAFVGEEGVGPPMLVEDAIILDQPLGCDVVLDFRYFEGLVLQIDYPNARFRYLTRSASSLQKEANTKIKVEPNGRVFVEVEVGGRQHWLLFDTGAAGALELPQRAARDGGWLVNAKPDGELMVLDKLKIGPYELQDVPLAVENRSDRRKAARPPKLGYDVLRHFVVTLDFELGLLHLHSPE